MKKQFVVTRFQQGQKQRLFWICRFLKLLIDPGDIIWDILLKSHCLRGLCHIFGGQAPQIHNPRGDNVLPFYKTNKSGLLV